MLWQSNISANVKVIVQTLNISRAKIFILIVQTLKTYVHLYIPQPKNHQLASQRNFADDRIDLTHAVA